MEVIISEKINKEHLGIFTNAFFLTNYEYSHKTAPPQKEEDKKDNAEEVDERTKKFKKVISNYRFLHPEFDAITHDPEFKFW